MDTPRFRTNVDEVPDQICDLNTRLVVEYAVYGTEHPTSSERARGALRKSFVVSRRHPFTKTTFRSTSAIAAEIVRHMETAPYIIHPYSLFRSNYEIYMFILFMINVIYLPLYIWRFSCSPYESLDIAFMITCFLFLVDVAVNFRTGYTDKTQLVVVLDWKQIAKRYVSTFFFLDLFTSIPYVYIFCCTAKLLEIGDYYWLDMINVWKIFRLYTMFGYYNQMCFRMGVNVLVRRIVRVVLALMVYLHWVTCFCSTVSSFTHKWFKQEKENNTDALWIKHYSSTNTEYTWRNAMLRAITLTFACGFRIIFTDFGDMFANIIFFVLGNVVVVLVAVRVVIIGRATESSATQFESLHMNLVGYMRHKRVTPTLERRLLEYYSFSLERTYYHEPAIMGFLSGQLKKDLLLQKGHLMMEATDLFDDIPPGVMVRLMAGLRTIVVLPGAVVLRKGRTADRLVYVSSGTLAVYDAAGTEICHVIDGQVMGEDSLITTGQALGVTVIALETSELWILTCAYFMAATRTGATSFLGGEGPAMISRDTLETKRRIRQSKAQAAMEAEEEAAMEEEGEEAEAAMVEEGEKEAVVGTPPETPTKEQM